MADDRVKQVKEANDIVDVVGSYIPLRRAGPTFKGICPFHEDHRPSFDVDPRRQRYRCWACGEHGDVITFVQKFDHVTFAEALELLARRAGILLEKTQASPQARTRALMLDVVQWSAQQYHGCLLESPLAEEARGYLGQRGLTGETVSKYQLGFAPRAGDWLVRRAEAAGISLSLLEQVGMIAPSTQGSGYYDRFRDRVQFPIRNERGQTVGFGGRILPNSPLSSRAAKYYNTGDTPLFKKSEQLYGIEQARVSAQKPRFRLSEGAFASLRDERVTEPVLEKLNRLKDTEYESRELFLADVAKALREEERESYEALILTSAVVKANYLAVVEGYTDVLMAHQMGVLPVVATMGTALNDRHLRRLRHFAPRVVLVFDADAGGTTGVDRALELFVGSDAELTIAALPAGLDPCDLLLKDGPDAFRKALEEAIPALDFKLNEVLAAEDTATIEGKLRVADAVLKTIAFAPRPNGQIANLKTQLIVTRIARRLHLKEENVWGRLEELRREQGDAPRRKTPAPAEAPEAKALPEERELLEVLLAEPALVPAARTEIAPEAIQHSGLRRLLQGLYGLQDAGAAPTLDNLRPSLDDVRLETWCLELQELGNKNADREDWLRQIRARFKERRQQPVKQELQTQLQVARDHASALELLRQLQNRTDAGALK